MWGVANCVCSVLRGTAVDEWADVVDDPAIEPVIRDLPATIIEQTVRTQSQGEQSPRTITRLTGAVSSSTDIRRDDLLRDETHGFTYTVRTVHQPNGIGHTPDLELELDLLS